MKISKSELEKLRPISPISYRKLFLPTALAALLILGIFLLNALLSGQSFESEPIILLLLGLGGSIRGIFVFYTFTPSRKRSNLSLWVNATIAGIGLGVIAAVLPERLYFSVYILVVLNIISVALTAGRNPSYLIILLSSSIQLTSHVSHLDSYLDWLQNLGLPLLAIIITETILRLQNTIRYHIKRLETINKFTRQIASSIETKQVISLLNAAIQTALEADTYFIGLLDGDRLD
ncbi:MAG: hypothetical protein GXP40_08050, partial [Chloroflexi bacterium]|nr:hypothetical protein [Chloroflexota bacterium]